MKRTEKAFTLVELLVVISIIALLLAILMPALSKVKEQGRTVVCGTNLKNYGHVFIMYAQDNDGRFPNQYWLYSQATWENTGTKTGGCPRLCRWHFSGNAPDGSLWPYLRTRNVNMCPTFRSFTGSLGPSACPNAKAHTSAMTAGFAPGFSYVINAAIAGWRTYGTGAPFNGMTLSLRLVDVDRPAQCMAFSEENLWTIAAGERIKEDPALTYSTAYLNDNMAVIENWTASQCDNIGTYHKVGTSNKNNGYANCVFVDGHVEVVWGKAGYHAYNEYAKPYAGHEQIWR